jgi:hypothetical protein
MQEGSKLEEHTYFIHRLSASELALRGVLVKTGFGRETWCFKVGTNLEIIRFPYCIRNLA